MPFCWLFNSLSSCPIANGSVRELDVPCLVERKDFYIRSP